MEGVAVIATQVENSEVTSSDCRVTSAVMIWPTATLWFTVTWNGPEPARMNVWSGTWPSPLPLASQASLRKNSSE